MKERRRAGSLLCRASVLISVMLLLLMSASLTAQTIPFREYTIDDGLPQIQAANVMQDSRAYIWVTSRNGLARYDGSTFVSYQRKDGLPSNLVNSVFEDAEGMIWAMTGSGMARFNGSSFEGYPIPDSMQIKALAMGSIGWDTATFFIIGKINPDRSDLLLFKDGAYYDLSESFPELHKYQFTSVVSDPQRRVIYLIDINAKAYALTESTLRQVHEGPVLQISLTDHQPLFLDHVHHSEPPMDPFHWERGPLTFSYTDRDGSTWVGTEANIYRLLSEAFTEYDRENGLPEATWTIVPDPQGGLWTGSINGDLKYFDGKEFHEVRDHLRLSDREWHFYRGSALLSNGEVWFSHDEGVMIWDGKRFRELNFSSFPVQVCIIWENPVDNTIFLGTDNGLFIIADGKVKRYEEMSWAGLGVVEGVARDHNGNHWLAGHYGLVFFDGEVFTPYRSPQGPAELVWGVLCDPAGNIWCVGSDGLYFSNPDNPKFIPALPAEINEPANVIRQLDDNRLIVGRMLDICIIDLKKYYDGNPYYYQIIDRSAGFRGRDCQDNGMVRDSEGEWWILTSNRLIRFDPEKYTVNDTPPVPHVTKAEMSAGREQWINLTETPLFYTGSPSVKVKGRRTSVRVTYTGISTKQPEKVRYRHRLTGVSNEWSEYTADRSVTYNNLPAGELLFEVQAFNSDGVVSLAPASLMINVRPTFFQSPAVLITIIIIAIALIAFLSLQIRKNVQEKRVENARQQAETYRLQLNSVIRQFDPHFTFNAVSSVGSLIMKGEKEKAYNYFIKLSNLLRSIITDSSLLFKSLDQELEFVTRYCELQKLRFGNRFEYSMEISPEVSLKIPVPKMIIQSFVENAIKHGLENKITTGVVEVSVANNESGIFVTVRDNGIGRAAASEMHTSGTGTGLRNITGIVDIINKTNKEKITFTLTDLFDEGSAAGTEAKIFLPYNYSFALLKEKEL